jgi:hypothetical protein
MKSTDIIEPREPYTSHVIAGIAVGLICCTLFYFALLPFMGHKPPSSSWEGEPTYVIINGNYYIPSELAILLGFCITPACTVYSLIRARYRPINILSSPWVVSVLAVLIPLAFVVCLFALLLVFMWGI